MLGRYEEMPIRDDEIAGRKTTKLYELDGFGPAAAAPACPIAPAVHQITKEKTLN
jgi:hypothetical protein